METQRWAEVVREGPAGAGSCNPLPGWARLAWGGQNLLQRPVWKDLDCASRKQPKRRGKEYFTSTLLQVWNRKRVSLQSGPTFAENLGSWSKEQASLHSWYKKGHRKNIEWDFSFLDTLAKGYHSFGIQKEKRMPVKSLGISIYHLSIYL